MVPVPVPRSSRASPAVLLGRRPRPVHALPAAALQMPPALSTWSLWVPSWNVAPSGLTFDLLSTPCPPRLQGCPAHSPWPWDHDCAPRECTAWETRTSDCVSSPHRQPDVSPQTARLHSTGVSPGSSGVTSLTWLKPRCRQGRLPLRGSGGGTPGESPSSLTSLRRTFGCRWRCGSLCVKASRRGSS